MLFRSRSGIQTTITHTESCHLIGNRSREHLILTYSRPNDMAISRTLFPLIRVAGTLWCSILRSSILDQNHLVAAEPAAAFSE